MQETRNQVLQYPCKWSDSYVFLALEKCTSVSDLTKVARYCSYDRLITKSSTDCDQLSNAREIVKYSPGRGLVLVLLLRAELLIREHQDELVNQSQISAVERDLAYAFDSKYLSAKFLWKVCIARVKLALLNSSNFAESKCREYASIRTKLTTFERNPQYTKYRSSFGRSL